MSNWRYNMKIALLSLYIGWLMILLVSNLTAQQYELAFSTFFGGSAGEGIRDVETDGSGNVYVAGTTRSPDLPTTPGAYDEQFDTSLGTTRWGYNSEIFVAKFARRRCHCEAKPRLQQAYLQHLPGWRRQRRWSSWLHWQRWQYDRGRRYFG
jgi:hypothetical protein